MQNPNEFNMVEKPIIKALEKLGYSYLRSLKIINYDSKLKNYNLEI